MCKRNLIKKSRMAPRMLRSWIKGTGFRGSHYKKTSAFHVSGVLLDALCPPISLLCCFIRQDRSTHAFKPVVWSCYHRNPTNLPFTFFLFPPPFTAVRLVDFLHLLYKP